MGYDGYGNSDYLQSQIVAIQQDVQQAQANALGAVSGSSGQIAIYQAGTGFVAGNLSGDSGRGLTLANVASPLGISLTLAQGLRPADSPTFVAVTFTDAATTRTNLGLGTAAVHNQGTAVANLSTTASAGYVQAELQATIDKLNALLTVLRTAGLIAT